MSDTQYLAAKTIDEAVDAHAKANGSARFLAGGTDLLVQIKSGIRKPNLVIDIKKIVSYDYAKKFLDNIKDDTLCFSAHKILNGANQSEVILSENTLKKHNLFDKIFNFFDS